MGLNETSGSTAPPHDPAPPRWRTGVPALLSVAALGFAYGLGTNQIPSPDVTGQTWVSSLAAPYAILPFLAGAWVLGDRWGAIVAGLTVEYAVFVGWYFELGIENHFSIGELLSPVPTWLPFQVLVGVVFGLLGWLWWRRGQAWAGVTCAALLILEPMDRLSGFSGWALGRMSFLKIAGADAPWSAWNLGTWGAEFLLGTAAVALAVRWARHEGAFGPGNDQQAASRSHS